MHIHRGGGDSGQLLESTPRTLEGSGDLTSIYITMYTLLSIYYYLYTTIYTLLPNEYLYYYLYITMYLSHYV